MSGPNSPRGTTNRNQRGDTRVRAARRQWLLDTFGDGTSAPCSIQWDEHCLGTVGLGPEDGVLTVDRHPVPGIDGGTYAPDNIRPACGPCNSRAGTALRESRRRRPRCLDLFSCEGGAAVGYQRAGFDVTAVDIDPQPRHRGGVFVRADAFAYLREHGHEFDFVHASPMCRDHTPLTSVAGTTGTGWQVAAIRELLIEVGVPYVIENVMTAPLRREGSIVLCADNLGLRTVRHRRFEPGNGLVLTQPEHRPHRARTATSRRRERWEQGWHVSVTGDVGTYVGPEAMGIDWMSGDGLSQAIPPAYTEIIGRQVLSQLGALRVRS